MFLFFVLLFFYVALFFFKHMKPKPVWKNMIVSHAAPTETAECRTDDDCPPRNNCVDVGGGDFRCVPVPQTECNPNTGFRSITRDGDGNPFYTCTCRYPQLVTQKERGQNCDVDVACGVHGKLRSVLVDPLKDGICDCDEGFVADRDAVSGPYCRKEQEVDRTDCHPFPYDVFTHTCKCDDGYIPSNSDHARRVFHPEYLKQFKKLKCLKKPCTFNVMNENKPLFHVALMPQNYCLCDPKFGNFGVHLNVDHYLDNSDPAHYNACASVLSEDERPVGVSLYCYYYIEGAKPICYIKFSNIPSPHGLFGQEDTITVSENWPNNYFQYVFQHKNISVHTRQCNDYRTYYRCVEKVNRDNLLPDCDDLESLINFIGGNFSRVLAYHKMYAFPICRYKEQSYPQYKDQVIINPLMIETKEFPEFYRTTGLVVYPLTEDFWYVDTAPMDFGHYKYYNYPGILKTAPKPPKREDPYYNRF